MTTPWACTSLVLALLLLAFGWAPSASAAEPVTPAAASRVAFSRLATGLVEPTSVTSAGGANLFITERTGRVRVWNPRLGLRPTSWLDLRSVVRSSGGEQGLLGLSFDPRFAVTGRAYLTYTRADGALVLALVRTKGVAGGPHVSPILVVPHPGAANHNGGSLAWRSNAELLLGTGDGGGAGDGFDNARRPASRLGKVLIVEVNKARPTARVWLSGVRNPWKMSVDSVRREVLIGDVGQDTFEEVDRVPLRTVSGDLGWPCREGLSTYDSGRCAGRRMTAPLAVFCHDTVAGCPAGRMAESIIGGYVYRGRTDAARLAGQYVAGDFVTGNVWTVAPSGAVRTVGSLPQLTSFGETASKEIVAVTYDGSLWRLRATA